MMFKRGGVWWTCIRVNGKKIQKSLETSEKKLAKAIESKIRTNIVEGKYLEKPKDSCMTVKELIEKFLHERSQLTRKEETKKWEFFLSKKIILHLGSIRISELRPEHITGFMAKRKQEKVSEATIHHELNLLRHAFSLAVKSWELLERSPFSRIKIPKGTKKRVRYLSEEEEAKLFRALPAWLVPLVVVAKETGLRVSNVTSLSWKQVDLFTRFIVIDKTKNNEPVGLPMTDKVFDTLKSLAKVRSIRTERVFLRNGKPLNRFSVSKSFKKACKKAGVEDFRFHDLRHDFCSKLVQKGVDLYAVSALAGHKDIKTTQRYAHLSPERLREAVRVLNSDYSLTTVHQIGAVENA